MKFNVNQTGSEFIFKLTSDAGMTLVESKNFPSQDDCVAAIRSLIAVLPNSNAYILVENSFSILVEGEEMAKSIQYGSRNAAEKAIDALITDASDEAKYEVEVTTETEVTQSKFADLPTLSEIDYAKLYDFTQGSKNKLAGFEELTLADNSYAFVFNSATGKEMLYSRKFSTTGKRDKRINQLTKAAAKDERFEILEEKGAFYFIMKARNQAEIARSRMFINRNEAEQAIDYVKLSMPGFRKQYPDPVKKERKGNIYNFDVLVEQTTPGFHTLRTDDKNHYFIFQDASGSPILYSQGYSSASGRDNGIKTVIRNARMNDQHKIKEADGKYYFIFRSGNRQETARSKNFISKAEAQKYLELTLSEVQSYAGKYGVIIEETIANSETDSFIINVDIPEVTSLSKQNEDAYLDCTAYLGHEETSAAGFRIFTKDSEHYFAMVDPEGEVLLRSEGYPNAAARSVGIASVEKNREIIERYKLVADGGDYCVVLKAGNHKEIARSCPYANKAEAMTAFGFLSGTGTFPWLIPIAASARQIQEEYLPCEEYKDHPESSIEGFRTFTHQNGQHYFAMFDNLSGETSLRSEGYLSLTARDNGIQSVLKNRSMKERYSTIEEGGLHYVVLKAGNHQEIARSCPRKSAAALFALFPFLGTSNKTGFPWEIAGIAAAATAIIPAAFAEPTVNDKPDPSDKPNESKPTEGAVAAAALAAAATVSPAAFTEPTGADKPNKPIESKPTEGAVGAAAAAAAVSPAAFTEPKVTDKPDTPTESKSAKGVIGGAALAAAAAGAITPAEPMGSARATSTEPMGVAGATTPPIEPMGIAAKEEAPIAAAPAAGGGGIPRWLWALLAALLLGFLLWWLLRGCSGTPNEIPITSSNLPPVIAVDSVEQDGKAITDTETSINAAEESEIANDTADKTTDGKVSQVGSDQVASNGESVDGNEMIGGVDCGCDTGREPLFMRYAYEPKVLKKLGSNTEFGNSHALSPTAFYDKLNNAYYANEVDRIFLDRIFRSMGYAAGWSAATPAMFSNTTVPYGTVGNIGYGKDHRTQYSKLNLNDYDQQAFLIKSRNGCDIRFMKTCGNHMFYCTK